eukprot:CAMPEP_0201522418 /NCGR_PEP_ID=MMETSP0161_2-20130828/17315_1 /ASSEMBLY_ACC=CAM_ASM_000251 /TAXON_ID=180227 /ORGANISM="Neoparamoeba aestuarina, Strain SoJaBio B1-5/56/2" /LENGTH=90 /DNA_ID=CAMNT_0047921253 /DNA_START=386 /DNA_END=658 /DNA_ORIENTATION=+
MVLLLPNNMVLLLPNNMVLLPHNLTSNLTNNLMASHKPPPTQPQLTDKLHLLGLKWEGSCQGCGEDLFFVFLRRMKKINESLGQQEGRRV